MLKLTSRFIVLLLAALIFFSCKKDDENKNPSCLLTYGDTLFYYKANDYTISPIQTPNNIQGTFVAVPEGLDISSRTGKINVSKSEGGQKYYINFISNDAKTFCSSSLTISGIDYLDSIYDLDKKQDVAKAFYNSDVNKPVPPGSKLDTIILGSNDISVISLGLALNKNTGEISLNQSLKNKLLGDPLNLKGGEFIDLKINYYLNDQSKTIQSITIRIHYFKKRSDIPASLLEELKDKQQFPRKSNQRVLGRNRSPYIVLVGNAY